MTRQPAPGEHEHFARLTPEQVLARYGKTPADLHAAAMRERRLGNGLVAYCLLTAAYGIAPVPHRPFPWLRIAVAAVVFGLGVMLLAVFG